MRVVAAMIGIVAMGLAVSPAWAGGSIHHNTFGGDGGQGGKGGNAAAASSASSTNVNVNTNAQSQGQQQGQLQGQSQVGVNVQGQQQDASNKGNRQSVNVESSLIPGVAVAPGLAAGGSQVCLGSFSVGLSGPMAGVAFGKTVVDKGCEDRQNAILLYNMGFATEALNLLKGGNERVRALFVAPVAKVEAIPDLTLNTPLGAGALSTSEAVQYMAPVVGYQGA